MKAKNKIIYWFESISIIICQLLQLVNDYYSRYVEKVPLICYLHHRLRYHFISLLFFLLKAVRLNFNFNLTNHSWDFLVAPYSYVLDFWREEQFYEDMMLETTNHEDGMGWVLFDQLNQDVSLCIVQSIFEVGVAIHLKLLLQQGPGKS